MSTLNIEIALSPNFRKGREGNKILAIVNHITAGLMPGALNWMLNPLAKVSAHYLVSKNGRIIQMVADEDSAFAVGNVNRPNWSLYDGSNPNDYTLSIEHEALAGESLTQQQYQASLELHWMLISKWQIPIDRDHIIGHYRLDSINRQNDPGDRFPWDRLLADLKAKLLDQAGLAAVNIELEGQLIDGLIINNRAYAPVRELFTILGRSISWDAFMHTVRILAFKPNQPPAIKIVIGSKVLGGFILDNSAYASVREICEALGHKVSWEESSKTVIIE